MREDANGVIVERTSCPHSNCNSSDAYTIYEDGHTHCYSCETTTYPSKSKPSLNPYKQKGEIISALFERKITKQTAEKYGTTIIGYDTSHYTHRYKYVDVNGSRVATKTRKISEKDFSCEGNLHNAVLYGQQLFKSLAVNFTPLGLISNDDDITSSDFRGDKIVLKVTYDSSDHVERIQRIE